MDSSDGAITICGQPKSIVKSILKKMNDHKSLTLIKLEAQNSKSKSAVILEHSEIKWNCEEMAALTEIFADKVTKHEKKGIRTTKHLKEDSSESLQQHLTTDNSWKRKC